MESIRYIEKGKGLKKERKKERKEKKKRKVNNVEREVIIRV
jgi:hypothetical protein